MIVTGWRGTLFSSINVYGGQPWDFARGQWSINWTVLPRGMAGPLLAGGSVTERIITVDFMYTGSADTLEVAFDRLMGVLDPLNDEPGTLTGQRLDGTNVEREAVLRFPFGLSGFSQTINSLTVEFVSSDPRWKETSADTASATFTANGNLTVNNVGFAAVHPTFTITPTSNAGRVGDETATIGWKYRRPVVITNNSDEDWHEELQYVWWGDTTGLTTAKAMASGADVRVWDAQGHVIRRQLQNWDTLATMIVFPVTLKAGATATYWVVYGNPAALTTFAGDPEYLDLDTRGGERDGYAAPDLYATTLTATSGSGTTFTVTGAGWEVDRFAGGILKLISGTGAAEHAVKEIASNTSDTITLIDSFSPGTAPAAGTVAALWMSGIAMAGGNVSTFTTTSLTDSSYSGDWATDQWKFGYVVITEGTGIGASRAVTTSSSTGTLTWATSLTLDTTSRYVVVKPGYQTYMVNRDVFDTDWRGLWRLSNYYESPKHRPRYGNRCPGAWTPFTRYLNQDNYAQPSGNDYGSGGGHSQNWFPNGRIRRQVRQDRHYGEHKQADGFRLYSPLGIDMVTFDYQWKNVGGICTFIMAAQTSDAVDFMDLVSNSATQASLTDVAVQSVNLTGYEDPITVVSFNVAPLDGVLIPNDTAFTSEAEFRTKDIFRAWVSPDLIGGRDATYGYLAVGAEQEAYDINARLALNNRIVQFGGIGRHTLVPLNLDLVTRLDPDTELPWCAIYDTGVLDEWAGNAVRFLESKTDLEGNAVEVTAEKMLSLAPGSQNVAVSETAIGTLDVEASWVPAYNG